MTAIIALVLYAVALAVMVVVHLRTERRLEREHRAREDQLAEQVLRRQQALDKQAKVFVRKLAQSHNAAMKLIDEARKSQEHAAHLREDTQALHQTVDAFMTDRRVQRFLDQGGG